MQYFMNAELNKIHYDFTLQNIMLDHAQEYSNMVKNI